MRAVGFVVGFLTVIVVIAAVTSAVRTIGDPGAPTGRGPAIAPAATPYQPDDPYLADITESLQKQFGVEGGRAIEEATRDIETDIRQGRLRTTEEVARAIRDAADRIDVSGRSEVNDSLERVRIAVSLGPALQRAGIETKDLVELVD